MKERAGTARNVAARSDGCVRKVDWKLELIGTESSREAVSVKLKDPPWVSPKFKQESYLGGIRSIG